ncbi:cytochrome P450 [Mycena olivaceomarginata]|nr:cytochrome P450 [Mycena olivaceomarginata]
MAAGLAEALGLPKTDWLPILILISACVVSLYYARPKKNARLPPGPRGIPFLGNILQVPTKQHWLRFAEMGEVWGDICSLTVLGQTMVIVNSHKVAQDLLDARRSNFSDRPIIPVGGELAGFNNALPLVQHGDRMRKERKLFHRLFGTHASVRQFVPLISTEVHKLLRNILLNPERLVDEITRATGAITIRIAYGYHLRDGPDRDPLLKMFETGGNNFFISSTPAAFLADIIPIFRFWPEWFPGGGFPHHRKGVVEAISGHHRYWPAAAGNAESSFVSTILEEKSHDDYLIKWAAAAIQIGGERYAFFLAMMLYPAVQAAAQRELDRVVGHDRLPDINDRAQLPYIDALCKEVVRWHVAVPLAVPHRTRDDYIYERGGGMEPLLIPKDSLIIPNLWKMAHDPARYSNPMEFDPSRFLANWEGDGKEAEPDAADICFGYGRRICPGRLLGETAIFLECSAVLSVFNISMARGADGAAIKPQLGQTSATVSHVLPFKCAVQPRNARALALIQTSS